MSAEGIILASGSPRRREILSQLGVAFEVLPSDVDEPPRSPSQDPADYACGLSQLKATAVAEAHPGRFVIGADTIVVIKGEVLGKPVDAADARAMLDRLSGQQHEVITGVSLVRAGEAARTIHERTQVWFRDLDTGSRQRYADSGEGSDKAGGYAIQDLGAGLVARIEGSYSNVVGLPAAQTVELLLGAGALPHWP